MNDVITIPNLIYEVRGHKVMLDSDLARLYEVEVKRLNEAVKRNAERFPPDFMFQLTDDEWESLGSQFVTSNNVSLRSQFATSNARGGRRYLPFAFTEEGVAMLSGILKSPKAVEVNIAIMRAFVQIRQFMLRQASKTDEIRELKHMLLLHIDNTDTRLNEHSESIDQILHVLNNLIEHPAPPRRIGFHADHN